MKKRIAIATLQGRNYGGRLQNYALMQALHNVTKGECEVESLWFLKGKNPLYPSLLSRTRQYSLFEIIDKWINMRREKRHQKKIDVLLRGRFELFDKFISEHLHRTAWQTKEDRNKWGDIFDVLVCGSDQIWNPNIIDDVYTGRGTGIKKCISYAASIGRGYLSKYEAAYMVPRINEMAAVSVREESAKRILKDVGVIKDIHVVVDPTMLLDQKEWNTIIAPKIIKEPYIFVYSFSDCKFKKQIIEKYKKRGMRVVFILYAERVWNKYDGKSPMEPLYDIGPSEFLSLIKNADVVFTDSFHGTVFSIIFNKLFYVYERNKGGKTSMNSRIYELLSAFGLGNRMLKNSLPELDEIINYKVVNQRLTALREDSLVWLGDAVGEL
jgi:hypothetical protein